MKPNSPEGTSSRRGSKGKSKGSDNRERRCFRCGEPGHFKKDCRYSVEVAAKKKKQNRPVQEMEATHVKEAEDKQVEIV